MRIPSPLVPVVGLIGLVELLTLMYARAEAWYSFAPTPSSFRLLRELAGTAQYAQSVSFRTFEFFIVTAAFYYVIAKALQLSANLAFKLMYGRS